ncbi:enoyl-CoA hydratase/isomerase family protein [Rhizobium lentis]|uniref:enoyl-CoA hydratase/isomerase family protein n=1 Tax=Rhizobium lentis TaxID=1138194 RepID=UPI003D7C7052
MLTGKPAYSEELQRLGIVSEIVPPERLESRALEFAKYISSMPPLPLQAMKQAIDGLAQGAFDDGKMSIALEQAFDGQQIVKLIEAMRPSE